MAQFFRGKLYVEPGADVAVDFDSSPKASSLSSSTVLVVGESDRGLSYKDKKIYRFTTPASAQSVLGGGKALDMIFSVFDPSPSVAGASEVLFVRTNAGYPAVLKTAQSGVKGASRYTVSGTVTGGRVGFSISIAGSEKKQFFVDYNKDLETTLKLLAKEINSLEGVTAELDSSKKQVNVTAVSNLVKIVLSDPLTPEGATGAEVAETTQFNTQYDEDAFTLTSKDKGSNLKFSVKQTTGTFFFYKDGKPLEVLKGISSTAQLVAAVNNSRTLSRVFVAEAKDTSKPLPDFGTALAVPLEVKPSEKTSIEAFNTALKTLSTQYQ